MNRNKKIKVKVDGVPIVDVNVDNVAQKIAAFVNGDIQSSKAKRVINIPKDQFDTIKEYCDKNSLDMTKWVVKNSLEKVIQDVPNEDDDSNNVISVNAAKSIQKNSKVDFPNNWMKFVVREINHWIKYDAASGDGTNEILWGPYVEVKNVYGYNVKLKLSNEQIQEVGRELDKRGYTLSVNPNGYTDDTKYKITW